MLSRHLDKPEVEQVTALVTKMFDTHSPQKKSAEDGPSSSTSSTVIPLHPRNRHLH
jgi:hypothetical protein